MMGQSFPGEAPNCKQLHYLVKPGKDVPKDFALGENRGVSGYIIFKSPQKIFLKLGRISFDFANLTVI
jgi:hypothetical protein